MSGALRRLGLGFFNPKGKGKSSSRPFPPEAFEYREDVKPEKVRQLQEEADKVLSDGEWKVIDLHDGPR